MNRSAIVLRSARREAVFTAVTWVLTCAYTVGYCAAFGYRPGGGLVLGMPSWVFWGILVPWTTCTLVTSWYALCKMEDVELEDPEAADTETSAAPGAKGAGLG